MKTIIKTLVLGISMAFMFIIDVPPEYPLQIQLVPEAEAIFGVRRRAYRRGAVMGAAAASTATYAATESHAAAAAPAPAAAPAAAPAPAPAAPAAPAPAASGKPLPLGTVVDKLPAGCTSTPVGGVDYYYCGGNFYRAVFQGNTLVYVTAKP